MHYLTLSFFMFLVPGVLDSMLLFVQQMIHFIFAFQKFLKVFLLSVLASLCKHPVLNRRTTILTATKFF